MQELDDIINKLASRTPRSMDDTDRAYVRTLELLLTIESGQTRNALKSVVGNERFKTKQLIELREELIELRATLKEERA